jgi:hypothetical protein
VQVVFLPIYGYPNVYSTYTFSLIFGNPSSLLSCVLVQRVFSEEFAELTCRLEAVGSDETLRTLQRGHGWADQEHLQF